MKFCLSFVLLRVKETHVKSCVLGKAFLETHKMFRAFFLIILSCKLGCSVCSHNRSTEYVMYDTNTTIKIIKNLFGSQDLTVLPPGSGPQTVTIDLMLVGVPYINEINMEFTISFYLRMEWNDSRLQFLNEHYGNLGMITLQPAQMNKLWKPDFTFLTERGSTLAEPLSAHTSFCRVYANGNVYMSRQIETTLRCQMKFHYYPFDYQECTLIIASYGYTTEYLVNKWRNLEAVQYYKNNFLTNFELLSTNTSEYTQTYVSGKFSRASLSFKMKRQSSFYIVQVKIFHF